MKTRDKLYLRQGATTGAACRSPAERVKALWLPIVGVVFATALWMPLSQGADNAHAAPVVAAPQTNRIDTAAYGVTNRLRDAELQTNQVPAVKTEGLTRATGGSASNAAWSLHDVFALPADHDSSTNRLLDFPAWDDTNNIPSGGNSSKGNRRMRSR